MTNCPDCQTIPGQPHVEFCEVERCTTCGGQRLGCTCPGHDPLFARWTGFLPGEPEAECLGVAYEHFVGSRQARSLFVKPTCHRPVVERPRLVGSN